VTIDVVIYCKFRKNNMLKKTKVSFEFLTCTYVEFSKKYLFCTCSHSIYKNWVTFTCRSLNMNVNAMNARLRSRSFQTLPYCIICFIFGLQQVLYYDKTLFMYSYMSTVGVYGLCISCIIYYFVNQAKCAILL